MRGELKVPTKYGIETGRAELTEKERKGRRNEGKLLNSKGNGQKNEGVLSCPTPT